MRSSLHTVTHILPAEHQPWPDCPERVWVRWWAALGCAADKRVDSRRSQRAEQLLRQQRAFGSVVGCASSSGSTLIGARYQRECSYRPPVGTWLALPSTLVPVRHLADFEGTGGKIVRHTDTRTEQTHQSDGAGRVTHGGSAYLDYLGLERYTYSTVSQL